MTRAPRRVDDAPISPPGWCECDACHGSMGPAGLPLIWALNCSAFEPWPARQMPEPCPRRRIQEAS